ncbi:MAG: Gfo/Idh/MocA family oxidoreductase [Deltaproteobacteria bacterium]|nr:Gfo/Idh/MocA family oxidoreductase [Deltaproteobacteria bacterium]
MRIGVIGFGKMGMLHAGIVNSFDGVEFCAVTDTTGPILKALKANKPSIAIYDDYKKMLDQEKPDAVFITTPTFLHVPMAMECIKRGVHFFIEKPLSISCESARPLLNAMEKDKTVNMVGYMGRFIETFSKAWEIIHSGVLGEIVDFNATMYVSQLFKKGKGWRYKKPFSGGGVLITQNSHLIDLLLWYFGDVKAVNGHIKSYYSGETEDFAHVFMEFKDGTTGWFDASWSIRHHRMVEMTIRVEAQNGTLMVNDDLIKFYLEKGGKGFREGWTTLNKPDLFSGVEIDVGGPQYTRQDRAFIDALMDGGSVEADVMNAYRVQMITDAVYESAKSGGRQVMVQEGE